MLLLFLRHYSYNIYFASFVLTQDSVKELNQNYDDMSYVTGVTGTIGTTFRNAVDKAKSDPKTKQTALASLHLQDFMDAISNQLSKLEDLKHFHMTHDFGGSVCKE